MHQNLCYTLLSQTEPPYARLASPFRRREKKPRPTPYGVCSLESRGSGNRKMHKCSPCSTSSATALLGPWPSRYMEQAGKTGHCRVSPARTVRFRQSPSQLLFHAPKEILKRRNAPSSTIPHIGFSSRTVLEETEESSETAEYRMTRKKQQRGYRKKTGGLLFLSGGKQR